MAFKKVNSIKLDNKENIKEFASKARGETGIIKDEFTKQPRKPRKQENHKNKFRYQFFCDQELKTQINNEKLESTSLFLRNIFFNKNEIFQDKNIVEIFFLAKKEGLSISSFIRKKLNLSHQDEKFNYDSEKKIPLVTYINQDDKNALNDFIEKEHINPSTYYYAKVLFFLENKKIFTFNEQMELRKQAQNYSLDFEEYIMLKIKN